jgi:P-type E1-E2 ATPase
VASPRLTPEDSAGGTVLYISRNQQILGVFVLADTLRPEAETLIATLKQHALTSLMLTGDGEAVAAVIARQVGITHVQAGLLPADKQSVIEALQQQGKTVAMVGDGLNDAPSLTQADVGISLATGTDFSKQNADVILVSNQLGGILALRQLSKATRRNIAQNLFWAFIYNALGIPLAAGIGGFTINPMVATAAMSLSSVCVILNALRLGRVKLTP